MKDTAIDKTTFVLCANLCILSYQKKIEHLKDIVETDILNVEEFECSNAKGIGMETKDVLYICWTGTNDIMDVYDDAQFIVKEAFICNVTNCGNVHKGFYNYYKDLRDKVNTIIKTYVDNGGLRIIFTGHSLGSCIVMIALECALCYPTINITCITFGSPRIGDKKFVDMFNSKVVHSFRVIDEEDIVPKVPYGVGYIHVNNEIKLQTTTQFSWYTALWNFLYSVMTWKVQKSQSVFAHSLLNYLSKL